MKSRVILLLSLVMAIFTTFLFINYLQQNETKGASAPDVTKVVVAKEAIRQNQQMSVELVELTEVTKKDVHPTTLTSLEDVEGKIATAAIEKGEVILAHRVQADEAEEKVVSRKIKDGFRAVSVGVNIVQSVSNLIDPEDYVDVIHSKILEDDSVETEQLLSKVRVLAVGRKLTETTAGEDEGYVEYSSVTLELKPDDAKALIHASEEGLIHFTLHSSILPTEEE
ncbi:Flp pilus assembly protein CpaB [Aquibacillus albus]|uniref:Pilus assembly protein CpaB n=1 Tax=Aquibacillus albus TaxID=1168171 RepID=A0ABS2N3E1_9BACI|nr:Flp pilus assembly protein CpaB [Aquibacillus albus]MBM7572609.1 pilus assembly protein CpaB [Aquibacillus albus]